MTIAYLSLTIDRPTRRESPIMDASFTIDKSKRGETSIIYEHDPVNTYLGKITIALTTTIKDVEFEELGLEIQDRFRKLLEKFYMKISTTANNFIAQGRVAENGKNGYSLENKFMLRIQNHAYPVTFVFTVDNTTLTKDGVALLVASLHVRLINIHSR